MTKSEQGLLDIKGNKGDLILEFMHLYETMIVEAPEIVTAVIVNYEQELATAVASTNAEIMHAADAVVKAVIIAKKELE